MLELEQFEWNKVVMTLIDHAKVDKKILILFATKAVNQAKVDVLEKIIGLFNAEDIKQMLFSAAKAVHKEIIEWLLNNQRSRHESVEHLIKEKVLQSFDDFLYTEDTAIEHLEYVRRQFPEIVIKEFYLLKKIECFSVFENYEQAVEICFQLLNGADYSEKTKNEIRCKMIEWLLMGNYQLPDPLNILKSLNEKTQSETLTSKNSRLIKSAIEAYQFVMSDDKDSFVELLKDRLDQILSGNFSPITTENKLIWSKDIINLFQAYHSAYQSIEALKLECLIAKRELALSQYQSAQQIKQLQAKNSENQLRIIELEKLLVETKKVSEESANNVKKINMFFG